MGKKQEKGSVMLFDEEINYTIERKKVKNINFRFASDKEVKISAPYYVEKEFIIAALIKNKQAVYKGLCSFKNKKHFSLDNLKYVNGEEIYFLGSKVKICFDYNIEKTYISKDVLFIKELEDSDVQKKKKALLTYLERFTESFLSELSEEIYYRFFKDRVPKPQIKFKRLKSRWGSCCKAKNLITFNKDLIFLPPEFSKYVVVHEFCHLIVFDHSKAFYNEVGKIMPDYKKIRDIGKEYTR